MQVKTTLPDVLIIGASVRAAAGSALRAGLRPWCIDLFADEDLVRTCWTRRLTGKYPEAFVEAMAEVPPMPWMYTGGLENYPQLVDRLAATRELWGNRGDVLRRARDPKVLANAARSVGLPAPVLGLSLTRGRWLIKPRGGAGGAGIRFWQGVETPIGRRDYVQEYVEGTPVSAVYVGGEGGATLLGMTRQLVGEAWLHAPPFRYCGSIGPFRVECEREIQALGNILVERTGMRGLFGVDGVLREGRVWPVEVNPRYVASIEVLEQATGLRALEEARGASRGSPRREPREARGASRGSVIRSACASGFLAAKAILYAPRDVVFPRHGPWSHSPHFADVPHPGDRVAAGRPILTLFACDEATLRERAAEVEGALHAQPGQMSQR